MNRILTLILLIVVIQGCDKDKDEQDDSYLCNIQEVYSKNAGKVTISNGIWGTVAFTEGNCMPLIDPNVCKTCAVKRTVKIYEFTMRHQANPATGTTFYDSFNTRLIKEVTTDNDGFFQMELPAGDYTIVVVENGKLYANRFDGLGGISPVNYTSGTLEANIAITYKATF